ncbi:Diaminopimelate epimerase-like protein [Guyanagaster necrorhizus]|uniref:Diaminopimelate epimerase-like protein n=1 Tax=Guyanagaster necrorhizus TaxID=856835 RepID=A0A9P7VGV5_9AGAR|nr:Diaminopimelate epimerase-like protein [Guyanagaster necrorhizus MCA 3950]KAG7440776.1 Diaminopimelate epimerase-like protein [Guyanagaster necrorhizus MCA 3950]
MSTSLTTLLYSTLDVFTTTGFHGNPLAIVLVPSPQSSQISQQQKQNIAREFNFSETVFVYDQVKSPDSGLTFPISIFTTAEELPFAGHPTVGTGWYLLRKTGLDKITLRTKAGDVLVIKEDDRVRLKVPTDFKVHQPYTNKMLKEKQLALEDKDYVNGSTGAEAVVSIVKGMSFIMIELSSVEALGKLQQYSQHLTIPDEHLGDWKGFGALYAFVKMSDGTIRTRLLEGTFEDPATGSAASALGGWLGQSKGDGNWKFDIIQGVEMGRRSEITVFVGVSQGEIKSIELAGSAVQVMEGRLNVV